MADVKIISTRKKSHKQNKRVVVINPDGTLNPFQISYAEFAAVRIAELIQTRGGQYA